MPSTFCGELQLDCIGAESVATTNINHLFLVVALLQINLLRLLMLSWARILLAGCST